VATTPRQPLVGARTSPEKKAKFAALAASRGMSELALLTMMTDTVLEAKPVFGCAADRDVGALAT